MSSEDREKALKYLSAKDPILAEVIKNVPTLEATANKNYFTNLCESIVSQQLSVKAADTIWKRFITIFNGNKITAEAVLNTDNEQMRKCGISYQKISYIKDLAAKTLESGILFEQFDIMTDEEIITELVEVKGIGRWTAEMFLMFTMERADVFSYGDLGLRRAIERLYHLRKEPTQKKAQQISKKWKPYRTLASRYLWKSLEMT